MQAENFYVLSRGNSHFWARMAFERKHICMEAALRKIKHYCAYRERSHSEVKDKLYGFGLYKSEVEQLISTMVEENYLNEERYAIAFAGGHFRMKQWGRTKIKYEMKQKGIGEYCIRKALASIGQDNYQKTFNKLAREKQRLLKSETNIYTKKKKLQNYLLGKGYEFELIAGLLKEVI